jgi:formate-dependent nitrite reductase membrane component NrfD
MTGAPVREELKAPHYGLPVALDFFLSGTSSGAAVTAAIALVAGGPGARAVAEAGYLIAFPTILICLGLLSAELGRPMRFLHMLWSRKVSAAIGEWVIAPLGFHLKLLSPMSVGAWGLSAYSALTGLSLVFTWVPPGWAPRRLELPLAVAGALLGFFVGGYKGVLLRATAQPIWRSATWLGPVLLASAASSGVAAIFLVNLARGGGMGDPSVRTAGALALTLVIQAVLLILFLHGLGEEARSLWRGHLGLLFWGGAIAAGTALPLVTAVWKAASPLPPAAVLVGSFALRYCILMAPTVALEAAARMAQARQ